MERVLQVMLANLMMLIVFAIVVPAAEFCSLTVEVIRLDGGSGPIRVSVQEANGRRVSKTVTRDEVLRFCNLGLKPVQVFVGSLWCNQVVVNNVPVEWNKSNELKVGYDGRLCNGEALPVSACRVLLRFVDKKGDPVPKVEVSISSPYELDGIADSFGRLVLSVSRTVKMTGIAGGRDLPTVAFSVSCSADSDVIEEVITLI